MNKPTDLDLLDHYLGRGDPRTRRQLDQALEASPKLHDRREELISLWQLLGEADAELPSYDLWPNLAERLASGPCRPVEQDRFASKSWWAVASAAVVAAALVGYGSGQLRLDRQAAATTVTVNESDVITQLQLTVFGSGSVQQLGQNLLEDDTQGST